jgi:hypothetical protein
MDARLNPYGLLGLQEGDAHVIRNAGGVITDDEIRSLTISQRLLGTREIILIHHTDCGMLTFTDDAFKDSVLRDTGIKPEWAAEAFPDLEVDVRQSLARIKAGTAACTRSSRPRRRCREPAPCSQAEPDSSGFWRLRPFWSVRPVPMHSRHTIQRPSGSSWGDHHFHPAPAHALQRSFSGICLSD